MRSFLLLTTLLCTFLVADVQGSEAGDSAEIFWKTFRQAVLRKDHREVASMTKFPFEVRGPDDSQPLQRINKQDFPAALNQVLSQRLPLASGGNIIETTMFDIIKGKPALVRKDFQTPTSVRVHQFIFKNIGGQWLFTRAYLE